jgi:uncharacterized protein
MTDSLTSPCIKKCCLNENDICLGCFRSITEITGWQQANEQQRYLILENAKNRSEEYRQQYLALTE